VELAEIARALDRETAALDFPAPVAFVYRPLDYAREPHEDYLRRWAWPGVAALLLGMNPGPFGMAQTGVPFGEVRAVRDWLGVRGAIGRPAQEHPKRPVEGFACRRSEISGQRLWGWAQRRYGRPDAFFAHYFVLNYCPLAFLDASGRNLTPDKFPASTREPLHDACDRALRATVSALRPRAVVGVGAFAAERARRALAGVEITVGTVLHPSPASPAANRGWAEQAERQLAALGLP
jgi:single-strand selective monofunctional uracil DNA glycosylase